MKRFLAFLVAMMVICSPVPYKEARAQAGAVSAVTVGAALEGLRNIVKQLEQSASFLLSQGNNALAQQQMLLAGILKSVIEQASVAYADSLNKTFNQLNVAEQNAFNDLFATTKQFSDLEKQTSKDVQATIYKTQGAANQILNRIPLVKKTPVFYGITVRDLTADPSQNPADIEILGFLFSDDRLKFKKPVVKVGGQVIDAKFVSVQDDRVQVQIPDPLKKTIGFGNSPCNPRTTFPVSIDVYYAIPKGFWPIEWNSEKEVGFNANALAGSDRFDVVVTEDGSRTNVSQRVDTFTQVSGNVTVGCEEGGNGAVRYDMPANASEINCSAAWVNTDNLKSTSQSACAVGGTTASATGTLQGLDRDCVPIVGGILRIFTGQYSCNCRGGGHGHLQISGNYKVPVTNVQPFTGSEAGKYVMVNGRLSGTLATDSALKRTKIAISIRRSGCTADYDHVSIVVPENQLLAVTQSSEKGQFKATFRNGQLTVESAKQ